MAVEFCLLGTVEAEVDGRPVDLGHARQRAVLAVLLVEANRAVSVGELVDRVWGGRPPQRAPGTVYSYLSRLRRSLAATHQVALRRQPGGYVLSVDPMWVDLHRFRRLVARAGGMDDVGASDSAATAGPSGAAGADPATLLDRALALWRGEPFHGLDSGWFCRMRHALAAERLEAELERNDLALAQGRHARLLAALERGARAYPLDERLAGQLMVARYRCGRRAAALAHYEQVRRLLATELGTDPAPALQRLYRQILSGDPVPPEPVTAPAARRPVPPRQLPAPPAPFTGRARQLSELSRVLDGAVDPAGRVPIAVISGIGGVGKTWLARRWAHDNRHRYPDGQLFVNLRSFDPTGEPVPAEVALRGFLAALGVPAAALPPDPDGQTTMFRSLTAGKRMLVVLDDARDTRQVDLLLPGTPGCTVVVTSRHALTGLVTAYGARPVVLGMLDDDEALQVLASHVGADRVAREPDSAAALVGHCAGLPLALGVAAARATANPQLPLVELAQELADAADRLDALDGGEPAVDLRAVLSCSYRALRPDAAEVFPLLGLAPGPDAGLPALASLTGLADGRVRTVVRRLADAHLVQVSAAGRIRMHDLVRLYARELAGRADPPRHRELATRRLLDHYLHTARIASQAIKPLPDPLTLPPPLPGAVIREFPGHAAALAWFTAEHRVLVAAVSHAADAGLDQHAWQLAWAVTSYLKRCGHWHDLAAVHRTALGAARRLGDPAAQAYVLLGLGYAEISLRRFGAAGVRLRRALALFRQVGDVTGEATAHRVLARLSAQQGRHRDALPHDERALALYRAAGHRAGQATALNAVGWHRAHLGQYRQALSDCQQAITLYRRVGDCHGQALAWHSLGYVRHQLGEVALAIDHYRRARDLFCRVGDRYYEAVVRASLGGAHLLAGEPAAARDAWQGALRIFDELGHPAAESVRASLATSAAPAGPGLCT